MAAWRMVVRMRDGEQRAADPADITELRRLVGRARDNPDVASHWYWRVHDSTAACCPHCEQEYAQESVCRLTCRCGLVHVRHRCRHCHAPAWFDPPLKGSCGPTVPPDVR